MTVPNGSSETATFASSNATTITLSRTTDVDSIVFSAGADAFTISTQSELIRLDGGGVINNSALIQNVVVAAPFGLVGFNTNSSAGHDTTYTIEPDPPSGIGFSGAIIFFDSATAGDALFLFPDNRAPRGGHGGFILFEGFSTAGNAQFNMNGGIVSGARGAFVTFYGEASAAQAVFAIGGGIQSDIGGSSVEFQQHSSAGEATLMAESGSDGGSGGMIQFKDASHGAKARVELFGNGTLDISLHNPEGVAVGSIEGEGNVFLGSNKLTVGLNQRNTNFSGVIQDGGENNATGGSLGKTGTGKFVLSHRNSYTGGTTVMRGKLMVNNVGGSGTGTGPVHVEQGELGGTGEIAGAVTLGTGTGAGSALAPGYKTLVNPGTLTIHNNLTFNSDATYRMQLNSETGRADDVLADGVTINRAQLIFTDLGRGTIAPGTVLKVIDNTSSSPISGTFSNLPDGSTFSSNGNSYKVNYQGGDGNDLTLTVVL